jgi:N-acetyl-gamma-glutamyl-phosphate reductase
MIKAGIIGGAGYTGGEMLRLLIHHPKVKIAWVHSKSNGGKPVSDVHTDLFGDTNLRFASEFDTKVDVVFLCVGHGEARKFLKENPFPIKTSIIDLSQDFRLEANNIANETTNWVYGLPELNREGIRKAQFVANPGCFATCLQLALLPLAAKELLNEEIHISATTGSTGAGQSLSATSHFSWRNNNLSVYKALEHQHLHEIRQSVKQLQGNFDKSINFIPYRGAFTRGILATTYLETSLSLEDAYALFENFYATHPFTHVSRQNIDLKQVVNTNKGLVYLEKHGSKLVIISMIDNLLKGASGQAVQNMNLMFGLDEMAGLRLKPVGM